MAKYCDLAKVGVGTGTSGDPYSFDDIDSLSKGALRFPGSGLVSDTLYIKGSKDVDVTAYGAAAIYITTDGGNVLPWDTTVDPVNGVDEPWRISANATASIGVVAAAPYAIEGGIIHNSNDVTSFCQLYGTIRSCFFLFPNLSTASIALAFGYGLTVIAPNTSIFTTGAGSIIQDGIFDVSSFNILGTLDATNCVFTCADDATPGTRTNCQYSWTPPTWPAWNDPRASFANSVLTSGVTTPPQPGNAPYTGYDKGLWRNARTGIGAADFYVLPSMNILPPVDNVGTGAEIFKQKTPSNENQLRSLVAGTGISLTQNENDISIASIYNNTYVGVDYFISPACFVAPGTDYGQAPTIDIYPTDNDFASKAVKFITAAETLSSTFFAADASNWLGDHFDVFLYGISDNADITHTIDLDLGWRLLSAPDGQYGLTGPAWIADTMLSTGAERAIRFEYQVPISSAFASQDMFQFYVRRNIDSNPGTLYFLGMSIRAAKALQ